MTFFNADRGLIVDAETWPATFPDLLRHSSGGGGSLCPTLRWGDVTPQAVAERLSLRNPVRPGLPRRT